MYTTILILPVKWSWSYNAFPVCRQLTINLRSKKIVNSLSHHETDTNEEDGALWAPNPLGKIEEIRKSHGRNKRNKDKF